MKNKYLITLPLLISLFVGVIWLLQPKLKRKIKKAIACNAQSTAPCIVPIQSFHEIYSSLSIADQDTLVVFDVDDVLITYSDMVLRPCGAYFSPSSWKDISLKEISYLVSIMLNEGQLTLIEPLTPQLINHLKAQGIKTIALTAGRTGKFGIMENAEDWRLKTLNQFTIDFSPSFPKDNLIYFEESKEKDYCLFKDGILFLGDERKTKGALLIQFLEKVQWKPKKVIFIDDKISHLISVELALKGAKIPFLGYLYKGAEKLPGELNEQIAEVQFYYLRKNHKWLSDLEVKKRKYSLS